MNRIALFFEKELKEIGQYDAVASLQKLVGDIHNHCGISYGYGSLENAIAFARTQLDFFSVTGHFAWPDMDVYPDMKVPEDVQAYHRKGFAKLRENWPEYKRLMDASQSESIIPFYSYEYHGFATGDYTILCHYLGEDLPPEVPCGEHDGRLDDLLAGEEGQRERFLCTPHHIGYKQGYRGINWDRFNSKVSPVVEIISMHGAAESFDSHLKYLHTMGPRSGRNTYQGGLALGHHFGVVGSTDHHNAAPGSYGYGRTVLYASSLDRDAIWKALCDRQTCAASGDAIEAMLFVNGVGAGKIAPSHDGTITIDSFVSAFDELDVVDIIQDGKVIASQHNFSETDSYSGMVSMMFGWGKKHSPAEWKVEVKLVDGKLLDASPRLRGIDMVDPLDVPQDGAKRLPSFSSSQDGVSLHVFTNGNATATTDSTQGFVMEVEGSANTLVEISVDVCWAGESVHKEYRVPLSQLKDEEFTDYVDGFVSPAFSIGRLKPLASTLSHIHCQVGTESQSAVYLRAYQKNGDCIYTSPVSFGG